MSTAKVVDRIGEPRLVVLPRVTHDDGQQHVDRMVRKIRELRISA